MRARTGRVKCDWDSRLFCLWPQFQVRSPVVALELELHVASCHWDSRLLLASPMRARTGRFKWDWDPRLLCSWPSCSDRTSPLVVAFELELHVAALTFNSPIKLSVHIPGLVALCCVSNKTPFLYPGSEPRAACLVCGSPHPHSTTTRNHRQVGTVHMLSRACSWGLPVRPRKFRAFAWHVSMC